MNTDLNLVRGVELTCPECDHTIRIARYKCRVRRGTLRMDYNQDIISSYDFRCPECGYEFKKGSENRVFNITFVILAEIDSTDIPLVHHVEVICPKCEHVVEIARCRSNLDAERLIINFHQDIQYYDFRCQKCKCWYDVDSIAQVNRSKEVI